MNWTINQEKAISLRGKNILVSAAAGSGKTAVLTQRIIKLIVEDRENIDSMLILTFTKAAANEMKTRIRQKLFDEMSKNPSDLHIKRQIDIIAQANISTMHSFCIELIRENFQILDIDPNFSMGNASVISILKDEAIQEIFNERYEDDVITNDIKDISKKRKDFLKLVDIYSKRNDDSNLIQIVYQIYNYIQSKKDTFSWLYNQAEKYNLPKENNIYISQLTKSINYTIDNLKNIITNAVKLCDYYGINSYKETLLFDLDDVLRLEKLLEKDYDLFVDEIKNFKESTLKKKSKEENEYGLEKIKKIRNNHIKKDGFEELKKYNTSIDVYIKYMKISYNVVYSLCELVDDFGKRYKQKKIEKNVFDFNDLEHFALKILNDDDCKKRVREKYKYIFYDEYQDSNDVQETIIKNISSGNNLFFVGDIKQSIYKFRLAEPDIFRNKSILYKQKKDGILINLSENFRSNKNIIDFCNMIFEKIMKEDIADIEYDDEEKLKTTSENTNGDIQINIVVDSDNAEDIKSIKDEELMANLTAIQINKLVKEKNIPYKDIIILKRSLKDSKDIYTKVFRNYGIPLFIDYSTAIFEVLEVSIFIDLLRIIDNIRQDEVLLAVLLSNIGNFDIQEITKIKISNMNEKYFYKIFFEYAKNNNDELAYKINNFISKINEYVEIEKHTPLDEYIEYLMTDSNYKEYVKAMPQGEIRVKNLEIVSEKAREFMQNENKSLFYFLIYIDSILKNKSEDTSPSAVSQEQNVVRFMSIHKSKGLESRVVILNDLQNQFNMHDKDNDILLDSKFGIGINYVDTENDFYMPTLARKIITKEYERSTIAEEIRILYVALTRAKESLILNSIAKRGYEALIGDIKLGFFPKELSKLKKYQDLILYAIADDIKNDFENVELYKFNEIDKNELIKQSSNEIEEDNIILSENLFKEAIEKIELTNEDIENIDLKYSYDYKYKEDTNKIIKTSVTYIAKQKEKVKNDKYVIEKISDYNYYKQKSEFTPEKIGTLNHLFLQHINFRLDYTKDDLKNMLKDLTEKEFIDTRESEVINLEQIFDFLNSPLAKRIQKADKIYQEESFIDTYDDMVLSGIVDIFFEENGYIVLLDYKTDSVNKDNIYDYAKKMYEKQIQMYKKSIEKAFNKKVKQSYIYFLSIDNFVEL